LARCQTVVSGSAIEPPHKHERQADERECGGAECVSDFL
jgi:hypothetical protein